MVVLGDLYFMHGGCEVSRRSTMSPLLAFPTKYLGVRTSNIGSIMPLGIKSCKFEPQPFRPKCITESSSSFSLLHSHFCCIHTLAGCNSWPRGASCSRKGRKQETPTPVARVENRSTMTGVGPGMIRLPMQFRWVS